MYKNFINFRTNVIFFPQKKTKHRKLKTPIEIVDGIPQPYSSWKDLQHNQNTNEGVEIDYELYSSNLLIVSIWKVSNDKTTFTREINTWNQITSTFVWNYQNIQIDD